jgi:hypothetical protein
MYHTAIFKIYYIFAGTLVMNTLGPWVVTILFISQVAAVTACPAKCACVCKEVTCRNASFTSLPSGISRDTTIISISYNNIPTLQGRDLATLEKLRDIYMNDNNIETIETKVFHALRKLRRLYLNNNQITHLHYETFLGVKSLRYLFLGNNKIEYIDVRLFKYVKKLKVLDVSRNRLKKLEPDTFQDNHLLSWVNFRHNQHIDTIGWKAILKNSLNFSDIQFCDERNYFYDIYVRPSKRDKNIKDYSDIKPHLDGDDKFETGDKLVIKYSFMKSENLSFEEYDAFIRTIGYDEYSTIITKENHHVTLLTDYPIFCYCKSHSGWFWCHELEANCSDNTSVLITFTVSKCSAEIPQKLLLPISVQPNSTSSRGDSEFKTNDDASHSDKTSSSIMSTERLVTYASIVVGIVLVMIITADIFMYKQEENAGEASVGTNRVTELADLNSASTSGNEHSVVLVE